MHLAHGYYVFGEFQASACQLRKAAEYLYVSSNNACRGTAVGLIESANELESLAKGSDVEAVRSVADLEFAFTRCELVLAADHIMKVRSAHSARHHTVVGYYMRSTATHLERARKWSLLESEVTIEAALSVRHVAETLIESRGISHEQVNESIDWLASEITELGHPEEPPGVWISQEHPVVMS